MSALEDAVRDAAISLPATLAEALATSLEGVEKPGDRSRWRVVGANAAPNYRARAAAVHEAWAACPDPPTGAAVALAVRAAAGAAAALRAEQAIEIVWTGPMAQAVALRRTREVLISLVREARHELLLVSFAAYRNDLVLAELGAAAERGVEVTFVLEDTANSKGKLGTEARDAFEELADRAAFYVWPAEKRPAVGHGLAAMHAKAVIADDTAALVTSANLTTAAIGDNMELGLLVRGGSVPRRLAAHFRALIVDGVLERVLAD